MRWPAIPAIAFDLSEFVKMKRGVAIEPRRRCY